jgi:hypothetical protein
LFLVEIDYDKAFWRTWGLSGFPIKPDGSFEFTEGVAFWPEPRYSLYALMGEPINKWPE